MWRFSQRNLNLPARARAAWEWRSQVNGKFATGWHGIDTHTHTHTHTTTNQARKATPLAVAQAYSFIRRKRRRKRGCC